LIYYNFPKFCVEVLISPKPMQIDQRNLLKSAACQELSNALYIIIVACTVDLFEISKVLH
jgi:hypothetical protein